MQELMQSTSRIRRGWLDRLRGYKRVFETEITDGEHNAYGRGPTAEASQKSAQRIWDAEFWEATPELTLRSQVHTPLSFPLQGSCGRDLCLSAALRKFVPFPGG